MTRDRFVPEAHLLRDATLDSCIQYRARERTRWSEKPIAFLTGATGFLGANLLRDLLTRTSCDVRCLVRAPGVSEAMARLRRALAAQGLWRCDFEARIRPVLGDLASPLFGMSEPDFRAAGKGVEEFYHAAACVNLVLPYYTLRSANVMGTHELLRLASLGSARAFHHVSSISVFRARPFGLHAEAIEGPRDGVGRRVSGYAVTKWVAEQLVNAASERGLSVSICRPGRIAAHSETAAYNESDVFALLVAACIRLKVAPAFDAAVQLTPVDVVSHSIVDRSLDACARRRVFHLVNPAAVRWVDVVQALQASGRVSDCVPYPDWRQRLHREARARGERHLLMLDLLASDSRPPLPKTRLELAVATAGTDDPADGAMRGASYPDPLVLVDRYIRRISADVATAH